MRELNSHNLTIEPRARQYVYIYIYIYVSIIVYRLDIFRRARATRPETESSIVEGIAERAIAKSPFVSLRPRDRSIDRSRITAADERQRLRPRSTRIQISFRSGSFVSSNRDQDSSLEGFSRHSCRYLMFDASMHPLLRDLPRASPHDYEDPLESRNVALIASLLELGSTFSPISRGSKEQSPFPGWKRNEIPVSFVFL